MMLPEAHSLVYTEPRWQTVHSAWAEHLPAAFWLVEQLRPRFIVELGAHAGDSYCAFAQGLQALGLDTQGARAMAVDTWQGDAHTSGYDSSIYDSLAAHHNPLYGHFSRLNRCYFDDALAKVENGSVDLLHIDGLHTYDAVRHDFDTWLPKLSSRGVVAFHDVTEIKEDFGVWQLWDELKLRYSHLLLPHGHGLGIIAVGSEIPAGFSSKLSPAGSNELRESQQALIVFLHALGRGYEERRLKLVAQHETSMARNDALRTQQHLDTLTKDYSLLDAALHAAHQEHRNTEAHLHAITQSASWRVTAPLRKLKGGS